MRQLAVSAPAVVTTVSTTSARPHLVVVASGRRGPGRRAPAGGSGNGVYIRRRLLVVAALLVMVTVLSVAAGRIGAEAELADPVAGHVVVEPGQTLWDVAAVTAPAGVDTRQQLADLRELNGLEGSQIGAWTVVLVPAR